jgi:hypothetical protein
MTDDPFHDWDAAYVLGALDSDDRRAFEQHLATCAACSTAVAELAGMPGILGTLSADEGVALLEPEPVDDSSDGVVTRLAVAARRRRRRVRRAVAGAGLAAAVGLGVAGYVIGTADEPSSPTAAAQDARFVAMTEVVPGTVTADLRVEKKDWGTRFDWDCSYRAGAYTGAPRRYELVVTDRSGDETTVASWTASKSDAGTLAASTSVPTSSIRRVEIRLRGSSEALTRTEL